MRTSLALRHLIRGRRFSELRLQVSANKNSLRSSGNLGKMIQETQMDGPWGFHISGVQ
jgi:hypothetical protein